MALKMADQDPGTPDAGPYWPWRVVPQNDDKNYVAVRGGEIWANPCLEGGYCMPEVRGLMLPFEVFPTSFIYLQVWLNLSGQPVWASICHTSSDSCHFGPRNSVDVLGTGAKISPVNWFTPGEKWLNWPNLYALDRYIPYFGIDHYIMRDSQHISQYGRGVVRGPLNDNYHEIPVEGGGGNKKGAQERKDEGSQPINCWQRGKVEDYVAGKRPPHISRLTQPGPDIPDNLVTVQVTNQGKPRQGQMYQGINREMRKEIGAHRTAGHYAMKEQGDSAPWGHRRANLGDLEAPEQGGHYCPSKEYLYAPEISMQPNGLIETSVDQYRRFYYAWDFVKNRIFTNGEGRPTYKREFSEASQMVAYYPIATAIRTPADTVHPDGEFFDGIELEGKENGKGKVKFRMLQLAKTHVQFMDIIEGDMKLKILVPYQGMGSYQRTAPNGNGSNTFPDFAQTYEHSMSTTPAYRRVSIDNEGVYNAEEGGGMKGVEAHGTVYSVPKGGEDFYPLPQSYVDKMFNQIGII